MRITKRTVPALAIAATLVVTASAVAAVTHAKVRGRLTTDTDGNKAKGKFRIDVWEHKDTTRSRIGVVALRLDATRDDAGDLPDYDLWLVDSDDETEADFGTLRMNRHGTAVFRWRSKKDDLPDDVDEVKDFGGGTIEIRDADDVVVLAGDIPEFLGLDDDNEEGSGSGIRGRDKARLSPPDDDEDSDAKGRMKAIYKNRPGGVNQCFVVTVKGLPASDGPYDVFAIDDEDEETDLGEIETVTSAGVGVLRLKTKDGDKIPGDSVLDLAGQDVEIRDKNGDVVLEGKFPTVE